MKKKYLLIKHSLKKKLVRREYGLLADMEAYVNTLPPHTTKRTTTNLKTKNNQNCQKIELCGRLPTKKLKKTHSSILVGRVGSQAEDMQKGSSWRTRQSCIYMWINQEEQLGSETNRVTQVSSAGKGSPKTSGHQVCGDCSGG